MNHAIRGTIFLILAGVVITFYYLLQSSLAKSTEYLNEENSEYKKGTGTVFKKERARGGFGVHFKYTAEGNDFSDVLYVTESVFNKTNIGDEIQLSYIIKNPGTWVAIDNNRYQGAKTILMILASVLFLLGGFHIYRAIM